jgi:hypothetical protein
MQNFSREASINKLVQLDFQFIMEGDGAELLDSYLEHGFKGYRAYTDEEIKAELSQRGVEVILTEFQFLEVGARFFDPEAAEDFAKVSDTEAEWLSGGNYFTGELTEFSPTELVEPFNK